jgi:hypothetical protein
MAGKGPHEVEPEKKTHTGLFATAGGMGSLAGSGTGWGGATGLEE